jgi:hypothetical protein
MNTSNLKNGDKVFVLRTEWPPHSRPHRDPLCTIAQSLTAGMIHVTPIDSDWPARDVPPGAIIRKQADLVSPIRNASRAW